MILTVCSAKGAPGATTAAATITLGWPSPVALLELDSSGGSLAAWWGSTLGVSCEPGLVSLASSRGPVGGDPLATHGQQITEHALAVAAPTNPVQIRTAARSVLDRLDVGSIERDVVIDAGRLTNDGSSAPILARSDYVLIVVRPRLADVAATACLVEQALQFTPNVGLACVGRYPYSADDVSAYCRASFVTVFADDPRGADLLAFEPVSKATRRSALARSAGPLIDALHNARDVEPVIEVPA